MQCFVLRCHFSHTRLTEDIYINNCQQFCFLFVVKGASSYDEISTICSVDAWCRDGTCPSGLSCYSNFDCNVQDIIRAEIEEEREANAIANGDIEDEGEDETISNMTKSELKLMIQSILYDTMEEEDDLNEIIENLTKN